MKSPLVHAVRVLVCSAQIALLAGCWGHDRDKPEAATGISAPAAPSTPAAPADDGASVDAGANLAVSASVGPAPRMVERLGRGVVAVPSTSSQVLVSWRLLALDPSAIGFNVYKSVNGAAAVRLNAAPVTTSTNFMDTSADLTVKNVYTVRAVVDGVEQAASTSNTLPAGTAVEPVLRVPLASLPGTGYKTKFLWVGDLDGDGEFDFVIDRLAPADPSNADLGTGNQFLEAYKGNGTPLWRIDMGPASTYLDNLRPGAATLSMGMYDGVTVYDLDGDGKAEVVLKVAAGTKFPDGSVFAEANAEKQWLVVLDGMSGNIRAKTEFPTDFLAKAGRMGTQLGIGSSDGFRPAIYFWGRNRNTNSKFNDVIASFGFDGTSLTTNWTHPVDGNATGIGTASHQMRVIDVDGDGKDEFATGNYMLNSNGSLRYILPGVLHGDRFYIGKFKKDGTALDGYGIQQDNANLMLEYYYNATTGEVTWAHHSPAGSALVDVGRGIVADADANYPGFEVWSFSGMYNGPSGTAVELAAEAPYPAHMLWWDGDVMTELLNEYKLEKWNPSTKVVDRLLTLYKFGAEPWDGKHPAFFGDILGDWRTEVVEVNADSTALVIFTTNLPTDKRLYTMAQNPAYRSGMSIKGYYQSPELDYYLGAGMDAPKAPNVRYAGSGRIQAEAARLSGGAEVASAVGGFAGKGYVAFPSTGGAADFQYVDGGAGGSRAITVRFSNPGAALTGVLKVNGTARNVAFPSTGDGAVWYTVSFTVTLEPGQVNTLRFESSGQGLPAIDEISVPVPVL